MDDKLTDWIQNTLPMLKHGQMRDPHGRIVGGQEEFAKRLELVKEIVDAANEIDTKTEAHEKHWRNLHSALAKLKVRTG